MSAKGDRAALARSAAEPPAPAESTRTPKVRTEEFLGAWPLAASEAPVANTSSFLSGSDDSFLAPSGSRDTLPVSLEHRPALGPVLLRPGQRLAGYEIGGPIGRGGMGLVYEARDLTLRRPVAIKLLRTGSAARHRVDRFLEEARMAARIGHAGFVTVFAFETIPEAHLGGGTPYIVMERLHGRTLRACLDDALDASEWLAIFDELLAVLAYAHERSLVHRDLKPENVFRTDEGRVKILDLGLAGLLQGGDDDLPVLQAERSGTEPYMAPETWARERPSAAVDVWAVGVMLHLALFQGAHPFWRPGAPRAENIARLGDPEVLRALCRRRGPFPRGVTAVIAQALRARPQERFPDAAAMLAALRRARAVAPRRRLRDAALALAATLLLAAGAAALRQGIDSPPASRDPEPRPPAAGPAAPAGPASPQVPSPSARDGAARPRSGPEAAQPTAAGVPPGRATAAGLSPRAAGIGLPPLRGPGSAPAPPRTSAPAAPPPRVPGAGVPSLRAAAAPAPVEDEIPNIIVD